MLAAALCLQSLPLGLLAALPLAGLAALAAGACRGHVEPDRPARLAGEAEWAWLLAAKRDLDEKRARLGSLGGPGAASIAGGGAAGPATSPSPLAREADALAQQLGRRLVAYINADPPIEGAPLSARQLAAIRMKSDEEMVVAREFIARSADYRRACEIYEAALASDPGNPRLRDELARAQAARFMSAARFSRVGAGMTAEQVRAALGAPNPHDVRAYPDKGVVGWFYPKDAAGAAAAVWFARRDGKLVAYLSDWSALPAPAALPPPPPAAPRKALPADADAGDAAAGAGTSGRAPEQDPY